MMKETYLTGHKNGEKTADVRIVNGIDIDTMENRTIFMQMTKEDLDEAIQVLMNLRKQLG